MTRLLGPAGLGLVALTAAGLALHVPGADSVGSVALTNAFVALLAAAGLLYLGAVWLVLHRRLPRRALLLVAVVAAAMRLPVLLSPPFLSSDLFRYIWDGRVQVAGVSPYRFVPADPGLAGLRDAAIYPRINRADYAPTIYPPTAQAIFQAVARIGQTPLAMKLAMVGFELVAMLALLHAAALPPARLLIYAWNPLAAWTFAGNGHVDAAAIALVALALLARARGRDGWAGVALGAAILVKFLPVAIAPALWRRWDWKLPAACLATVAALYAPYLSAGWKVIGFLPAYGGEEGLRQGAGFWLVAGVEQFGTLPRWLGSAYMAACGAALLALAAAIAWRPPTCPANGIARLCRDAALLATALILAISPHYPWYFVWLALPCCVAPVWGAIYLSVAACLLYLDPWHERFVWPALVYAPAIVLIGLDLARRSAPRHAVRRVGVEGDLR